MRMSFPGLVMLLFVASLFAQQVSETGDLERVLLIDANQSVQMRDQVASRKGSWGVVVSKQYFVFKDRRAALRTKTKLPEFQFEMYQSFDQPVYLFRFDVHSDRREIRVAKGTGGLIPMSLPKDHIIETRLEEIGNGQNLAKRYRLKPIAPLQPGEYCLARRISTCFDFGVD